MQQVKQKYVPRNPEASVKVVELQSGKVLPHALDLEAAVLGAMLIDKFGRDEVMLIITDAEVFYKEEHKLVFAAMQSLYAENDAVDMLTVSQKLKSTGKLNDAGGDWYIIDLSQKISSSAHVEHHSRILLQYYQKRQIIMKSAQFMAQAYNDDVDSLTLLDEWASAQDSIAQVSFQGVQDISYKKGLQIVKEKIEFLTNKDVQDISGVSTGFDNADRFTGGFQPGDLVIIAARPGMGKTSVLLSSALAEVKAGSPVGIISAEMSAYQCHARTIAMETNFHLRQITKSGFEKQEYFVTLNGHIGRMENYSLHIDDKGHPDIAHVASKARLWKRKYDIKALYVDYLQLLSDVSVKGNREGEISSISRKLKGLAKELQIPVIALSQLSRSVETRGGNKRPMLSDLRESGAIEQDADIVSFIYRPEYYYGNDWQEHIDEDVLSAGGDTELIFAKYRGGAPNTVIGLKWIGDKTKYYDPAKYAEQNSVGGNDNWDEIAKERAAAYKPTANEAFGSDEDNSNNEPPF